MRQKIDRIFVQFNSMVRMCKNFVQLLSTPKAKVHSVFLVAPKYLVTACLVRYIPDVRCKVYNKDEINF